MPRIYYNETDYDIQLFLFLAHAIVYTVGIVMLWIWTVPFASNVTILWTALLAYHSYWRTPLHDGMQFRTYNRLRNRFGKDWDLAATREEFDLERKKAALEFKLKYVLPHSSRALLASSAVIIGLIVVTEITPIAIALLMFTGWIIAVCALQIALRLQLRDTNKRYDVLKTKQAEHAQQSLQAINLQARAGKTFAIGDDGELVEIAKKNSYN